MGLSRSPPKSSKFGILGTNLSLRGESLEQLLQIWHEQIRSASLCKFHRYWFRHVGRLTAPKSSELVIFGTDLSQMGNPVVHRKT